MIGIYCWTNKITGEQYVGQSIDIESRKKQHEYLQSYEENTQKLLYQAMQKYGLKNFIFSILEECSKEELDEREIF